MPPESLPARRDRLPPLVLLYYGLAHLALAAAFAVVALAPERVAGFFYHPRMVFVVHLVTLGWVTSSILGTLHLEVPARRLDHATFVVYFLGASGVIFHFWIDELSGVALSGLLVILVVGRVGSRLLISVSAEVAAAVKTHLVLAFANFFVAAMTGVLLAVNKLVPVLPGYVMTNVYAHAHLAALGWATMMVFAAGYRLLPSAMPRGGSAWAWLLIFESGVLGLFATLFLRSPWCALFALLTVAGIGTFFARLASEALPRPDLSFVHTVQAFAYLAAAAVLGLVLVWQPATPLTLRLATVYGVFGLVGFLAQVVVPVSTRRLSARLRMPVFLLWSSGVPALAAGFFLESSPAVALGGWLLLAAVLTMAVSHGVALRSSSPSAR